ncbi:hypothetical protein V1507DRAFT_212610 [Lipomyces tetrasporus]
MEKLMDCTSVVMPQVLESEANVPWLPSRCGSSLRHYRDSTSTRSSHQSSSRPFDPTGRWLLVSLPDGTDDAQLEDHAVTAFLNDYCLVPENHLLSRGYLEGLETLLAQAGPSSDLAQATRVVALASIGTKLSRSALVHKARVMYSEMLHSLQVMISNAAMPSTAESLMTAVLLGMYEIITATETHPSNHGSHCAGVYAILSVKNSPFDMLNRFQISRPLMPKEPQKTLGILCAPMSHPSFQTLDAFLVKSWPLLTTAAALLSNALTIVEDIQNALKEARLLNEECSRWPASQPEEWRPRTIAFINPRQDSTAQGLGWLSGRVDAYLDIYVGAVWNTYRKVRLMILDVIIRCSQRLEKKTGCHDLKVEACELASDMMASIPFHLSENLATFVKHAESDTALALVPGRSVGGLLLMHPLFVTANLSVVSPQRQDRMRECLAWIGPNMGIGQATLLSKTSTTYPNESVANGYTLMWAGMLFTNS